MHSTSSGGFDFNRPTIVSLLRAQRQEPMTNPESVLW
jgi:hypothetical protein